MKQYQKGEVMLVMMVVMLAVVWLSRGHMGMMGHGDGDTEKSGVAEQKTKAEPSQPSAPKESPEHQH